LSSLASGRLIMSKEFRTEPYDFIAEGDKVVVPTRSPTRRYPTGVRKIGASPS
jgi:hypothetical protein